MGFVLDPRDYEEWHVYPGLTVLVSRPPPSGAGASRTVENRPLVQGLRVDTTALEVDIDAGEFDYQVGADHLKDVSVLLFTEYERA